MRQCEGPRSRGRQKNQRPTPFLYTEMNKEQLNNYVSQNKIAAMKRKELLWNMLSIMMAALLSMGLSACGDDDTPELTVSTTSINLKVDGDGDKDIIVSASHTD